MNTNSIPETQTAKAKDNPIYIGTTKPGDNAYNLFALPEGHVVYVVSKEEDDDEWTWHEEHVDKTEVRTNSGFCLMLVYTKEGGVYQFEDYAFTTTHGAYTKITDLNENAEIKKEIRRFTHNIKNYM